MKARMHGDTAVSCGSYMPFHKAARSENCVAIDWSYRVTRPYGQSHCQCNVLQSLSLND